MVNAAGHCRVRTGNDGKCANTCERVKGGGRLGAGALTPLPVGTEMPALLEKQ